MPKGEAEVFTTESGLAVVTEDAESVRVAARKLRRQKNRAKAQKRTQRRTGGSKGQAVWAAEAKLAHKVKRQGFEGLMAAQERSFAQVKLVEV